MWLIAAKALLAVQESGAQQFVRTVGMAVPTSRLELSGIFSLPPWTAMP
jgi:hypothetical protein